MQNLTCDMSRACPADIEVLPLSLWVFTRLYLFIAHSIDWGVIGR
jgi:hypothetical protein